MEISKVIGFNLRRLRKDAGLTQQELADLSKLSVQSIRDLEVGRRPPSVPVLAKLAESLNVPYKELLEENKETKTRVSKILTSLRSVPDDVYDLARAVGAESKVWDRVRAALENEIEDIQAQESKEGQDKA
jgi:transcriptional regulator with XRE-family HTH domain